MGNLSLIGIGGFLGSIVRYSLGGLVQEWSRSISFPYGTITVNLLGCFFIGLLSQLAESRGILSPEARSFLFLGFLGSFTTFSTFGNETVNLFLKGQGLLSLVNIGLHIFFGLGFVWIGRVFSSILWS